MEIVKANIENILSIENLEIQFESTGLVLVDGWNADDNRANGAGKSAIFNAISFAIFEKIPRKITKTEILRKGSKKGSAYVEIKVGANTYGIKRCRPTGVEYFVNGVSADITQTEFESNIGLTYEQFLITMYTAQNTDKKFIFLNDRGKKDFILELMRLAAFGDFHGAAKKMATKLENDILTLEQELKSFQSQINIYKESMVDDSEISSEIGSHQVEISKFKEQIQQLQIVPKPDLSKYTKLEQKLNDQLTILRQVEVMRNDCLEEYQKEKSKSERPFIFHRPKADTECPECKTPLVVQGKMVTHVEDTAAQEEAARQDHNKMVEEAKERMLVVLKQIEDFNTQLNTRSSLNKLEQQLDEQKRNDFKDYDVAQNQISEYRRCTSSREQAVAYLLEKKQNNTTILGKMKTILTEAKQVKEQKNKLQEELDTVKFCSQIFAPTGAPAYIMDGVVDLFNEAVSEYVQMIWPSASYALQTHKVNKDKTVVAKFSEELMIGGKARSIGSLSGGELRSLSLALDFAILDVLTSQYGTTINPIILDEPFDGLDAVGREIVIDLLIRIAQRRQIIVIDHMSESKTLFSKIIRVEKKNGISTIVESD
jgi:DNA repair exonuclease SbcCD ATPase subunit